MTVTVASYGGGVNSTAMLIHEPADLVLFADTGGEAPETYEYLIIFDEWLRYRGRPGINVTQYRDKHKRLVTLEQRSLDTKRLPSLAYGFKKCSQRFKRDPQDRFVNNWAPAKEAWARGEKVIKLIGYDADEPWRAEKLKVAKAKATNPRYAADARKYEYRTPLLERGWGREECIAAIEDAGLPVPPKSACFFCPASKAHEVLALGRKHPGLLARALAIEANAEGRPGITPKLSRYWSWADVVKADRDQLDLFKNRIDQSCGCYDGSGIDDE